MIETRDQDFVAGSEVAAADLATKGAGDGVGERVMLGPKTISSAAQFRKSAMAARASASMASVLRLVA